MPLGPAAMKMPCAMINIVGPDGLNGEYQLKYFKELNAMHGVYVHLYGKRGSKPNRKLGHVTVLADTREQVLETAQKVRTLLEII
jgi:5-(carboxyamino)imidazole ribonucleotide synthase